MRQLLAACAVMALVGSASAQTPSASSVTLYGVIDTNVGWGKGSIDSNKRMGSGGFAGSRIGVRGVEDLGGGLRALYTVEHGFESDVGTAAAVFWNRQSFVGLSSPWGDVLLGRQYTPTFLVHATYDAFGPQGVAAQQVLFGSMEVAQPANIRANDAVLYRTPGGLGGFSLQAMVTDHSTPTYYQGAKLGYANGPFQGDLAVSQHKNPTVGDLDSVTLGARVTFGPVKIYGLFDRANSGTGPDSRGMQFSVGYLIGATELKASIAESKLTSPTGAAAGTTRRYGVGFVHSLSKRTHLYSQYAKLSNKDGARTSVNGAATAANQGAQGFDLGITHTF